MKFLTITNRQGLKKSALYLTIPALAGLGIWTLSHQPAYETAASLSVGTVAEQSSQTDVHGADCEHCLHPTTKAIREAMADAEPDAFSAAFSNIDQNAWWDGVKIANTGILPREALISKVGDTMEVRLGTEEPIKGQILTRRTLKNGTQVYGLRLANTGFVLHYSEFADGKVRGTASKFSHPVSYRIEGDAKELTVTRIAATEDYCANWAVQDKEIIQGIPAKSGDPREPGRISGVPSLVSSSTAPNVIYLDFDGELVAGTRWNTYMNDGNDIDAADSGFSASLIQQIWEVVAEDFRGFNVNVTTERSIYEGTPVGQRMMVIFTPTDTAAPGAGGVAFLGSFHDGNDDPCWVFNPGLVGASLAASHEVGHTLDLLHDGRTIGEEYYWGTSTWGPIMGAPYDSAVTQWSKGEYPLANNFEDDVAIMAGHLSFVADDHADDTLTATPIVVDDLGLVELVEGIISREVDKDVFAFNMAAGQIDLTVQPSGPPFTHNLNVQLRLLDENGNLVTESNPSSMMPASINETIAGGNYFLEVSSGAEGEWESGGYGAYGSIGSYEISGTIPPPTPGDTDSDGLMDDEELELGTDPFDPDTDGDGISDRKEVYPFSMITQTMSFDAALADASSRGGIVATLESPVKVYQAKRGLLNNPHPYEVLPYNYDPLVDLPQRLWVGGHDTTVDGLFRWLTPEGALDGPEIGSAFFAQISSGSNVIRNIVNVNSLFAGRPIIGSGIPAGTTVVSVNTTARTAVLSNAVTSDLTSGVGQVVVVNGGVGYTMPPDITFNPPGATAVANIADGKITSIVVTNAGSYVTPPTIEITGGNGGGAIATAVLTAPGSGRISSISLNTPGAGYTSIPTVVISGGGAPLGTTATAVASINAGTGQVTAVTVVNPGSGYTSAPTVTLVGGGASTPATATANLVVAAGRLYSPATSTTYSNWSSLLPGNRQNVPEAIFLNSGTDFTWGSAQTTSRYGYILERPNTDPLNPDCDGDGLSDYEEFEIHGTDPLNADTDDDGLDDFDEIYVYLTDPFNSDTDGDGLLDGEEINGLSGYISDPLLVDSDGDLFSDFEELNAVPPTNPSDPSSTPNGGAAVPTGGLFNSPELTGPAQDAQIGLTYGPFGHRPDTDKTSEDGSVAFRDLNGVIIWVDRYGKTSVIPNSSKAKTLYVSNTECVVWNNRFELNYNARGSESVVIIHRRDDAGNLISSDPISITGTLLDTCSLSPATYSFTLVACETDVTVPATESRQRYWTGNNYAIRDVDQWDTRSMTAYRITFDGQLQMVDSRYTYVPRGNLNAETVRVVGAGADGALVFTMEVARDFYDDVDDEDPGFFKSMDRAIWVTWSPNIEEITGLPLSSVYDPVTEVAYVSNSRLLLETAEIDDFEYPTGNYNIQDVRQRDTGEFSLVNTFRLPPRESILPVHTLTRPGSPPYFYSISQQRTELSLYRVDATMSKIGTTVLLPGQVLDGAPYARNPRDASLLVKSEGSAGILWIPSLRDSLTSNVIGLGTPRSLPFSTLAIPMFVSSREAVAWMNAEAPPDIAGGGVVPFADISHFAIGTSGSLNRTPLTPPIAGRYVAKTPSLSQDPSTEGWYATTFEKIDARTARLRTYRLGTSTSSDVDVDGLPSLLELRIGTLPFVADTDDDGLSDGDELYPFYMVTGSYTWEEARADAISRGGRLAVISNRDDYEALRSRFRTTILPNLWLGATDMSVEGVWRLTNNQILNSSSWSTPGVLNWQDFYTSTASGVPWLTNKPDNLGNADGLMLRTDMKFEDRSMLEKRGYLIEYPRTDPQDPDSDGDGILDSVEIDNGTDPTVADPFSGVPTLSGGSGPLMSFATPGVAGSYEGLVYDPTQGHVFHQTLTLNNKGSFSSSVTGLTSSVKGSLRGGFNAAGYYIASVSKGLPNIVSIEMEMVEVNPGEWLIRGIMHTSTGQSLGLELRQAKYNKANPNPLPARFTLALPLSSTDAAGGPQGDGVATGSTDKNGKMTLSVYMPDGGKASYSGLILRGDLLAVRALASSGYKAAMIGPMDMAPALTDRDIGGFLRYYAPFGRAGSAFPIGFEQHRSVFGSKYVAPARGYLPMTGYTSTAYNSLFNLVGGDFGGITKITTWGVDNKISIPKSPTDQGTAKFTTSSGLLTYAYTLTDAERMMNKAKANGVAVVLQKTARVTGHYTDSFNGGSFNVTPNDGQIPEITAISPTSKSVSAAAIVYEVRVQTPGQWQIVVPQDATWVTAEITSGGYSEPSTDPAVPSVPSTVIGEGNGVVRITLEQNKTNRRRETRLEIAGINHKIQQEFR